MNNKDLILQLKEEHNLPLHAWQTLISTHTAEDAQFATDTAAKSQFLISAIKYFSAASSSIPITAATTATIAVSGAVIPSFPATA